MMHVGSWRSRFRDYNEEKLQLFGTGLSGTIPDLVCALRDVALEPPIVNCSSVSCDCCECHSKVSGRTSCVFTSGSPAPTTLAITNCRSQARRQTTTHSPMTTIQNNHDDPLFLIGFGLEHLPGCHRLSKPVSFHITINMTLELHYPQ